MADPGYCPVCNVPGPNAGVYCPSCGRTLSSEGHDAALLHPHTGPVPAAVDATWWERRSRIERIALIISVIVAFVLAVVMLT